MRHYEFVIIVHPDQSEQVQAMVARYVSMIQAKEGSVSRLEDWGRRQLTYPIQKVHKAHYILMNVACSSELLADLERAFRFNDAILRYLVVRCSHLVSDPSPMMKEEKSRSLLGSASNKEKAPDSSTESSGADAAPAKEQSR